MSIIVLVLVLVLETLVFRCKTESRYDNRSCPGNLSFVRTSILNHLTFRFSQYTLKVALLFARIHSV